jgi:hypothetical protein
LFFKSRNVRRCSWITSALDRRFDSAHDSFGLCDLGFGFPELGCVSLAELRSVRGNLGLPIKWDMSFAAEHPMSVYAEAARQAERITLDKRSLLQAIAALAARREA